ncbi:MAG: F0F1 ATP synthase subunit gamma, partial [Clostridia bacterium]|nr:F0F1 ATP synthase subunit gamma [Clostridia bacterium]
LPDLLACIVYADICEAYACEQKMRRNAMDTAQKNADEMIEELKKRINRMRQARVTQEIIEATAGCRTENGGG